MNRWLVAARPATLTAAIAPVLVGSGLAFGDGAFRADALIAALVGAVAINVAVNFANDASDARRGADGPGRLGPPRAVASGLLTPRQVWRGTAVVLGVATLAGGYLAWISGWPILAIGAAGIIAALAYSGGPRPYGYRGLGELFVFVFFGLAAVTGSRYVHDATVPVAAWLLAIPVGMLASAILVANNVRDVDTDAAVGKRTLAVRLGRSGTRVLYAALVVGALTTIAVFAVLRITPIATLLALAAAPLAVSPLRLVMRTVEGPPLIAALRATARLHLAVGVLLAIGAAI